MPTDAPPPLTRRHLLALAAAAGAVAVGVPIRPAMARAADDRKGFFDAGKVLALDLTIAKEDMDSLRRDGRKFVKCQVKEDGGKEEGGRDYDDVGVRIKGSAGSKRSVDEKPALTFNADEFEEGQLFHGMGKLHLNNCAQDASYVSEMLAGEMYRAAGVPASRFGHATVTLNGRKLGLFALKEGYDRGFLMGAFGSNNGNFYDGGFLRDIDVPAEVSGGKGDAKDQPELKSLVEVSKEADKNRRFERMNRRIDVDKFVSYLALQMLTWDWDGYPTQRNNYRIYHEPKTDKLTWIPSGMDQLFGEPNGPLFPNYGGLVARAFIETPEGRKRYLARVGELLDGDGFSPDRWSKRLDELLDRVRPALESVDKGAALGLPGQFDRLRNGIKQRAKKIGDELKNTKA
ncbi:MAG: hypothetical protein JWO31_1298 [Phycisphaerales bacterium]|nr:hypothetical protein [Phycisphaerales bacterium]